MQDVHFEALTLRAIVFHFPAAGKQYSSVINNYLVGDAITYYNDQPWAYTTRNLRVQLNGSTGMSM